MSVPIVRALKRPVQFAPAVLDSAPCRARCGWIALARPSTRGRRGASVRASADTADGRADDLAGIALAGGEPADLHDAGDWRHCSDDWTPVPPLRNAAECDDGHKRAVRVPVDHP